MKKEWLVKKSLFTFSLVIMVAIFYSSCAPKPTTGNNTSNSSTASGKSTISEPEHTLETAHIAPAIEKDVLYYINEHRKTKGLSPLTFSAVIGVEARKHSADMAMQWIPFGHQGLPVRTKNISGKINGITSVSENVARGRLSAQAVVNLWLQSPAHRKNIEGDYRLTGIGVARDSKSMLYFTEIFAR